VPAPASTAFFDQQFTEGLRIFDLAPTPTIALVAAATAAVALATPAARSPAVAITRAVTAA